MSDDGTASGNDLIEWESSYYLHQQTDSSERQDDVRITIMFAFRWTMSRVNGDS